MHPLTHSTADHQTRATISDQRLPETQNSRTADLPNLQHYRLPVSGLLEPRSTSTCNTSLADLTAEPPYPHGCDHRSIVRCRSATTGDPRPPNPQIQSPRCSTADPWIAGVPATPRVDPLLPDTRCTANIAGLVPLSPISHCRRPKTHAQLTFQTSSTTVRLSRDCRSPDPPKLQCETPALPSVVAYFWTAGAHSRNT
jgi:hypothetical protein